MQDPSSRYRPTPDPPRSKDVGTVLAEAELQWLYEEDELLHTPTIQSGMSIDAEREMRVKGVTFIMNVGGMLNVPQTTVTTAAVYFHRFLMRYSLKPRPGQNPKEILHHYVCQCRRMNSLTFVANCRRSIIHRYQN
jgi:protein BUR2